MGIETLCTFFQRIRISFSLWHSTCIACCSSISHLSTFYKRRSMSNPISQVQFKYYIIKYRQNLTERTLQVLNEINFRSADWKLIIVFQNKVFKINMNHKLIGKLRLSLVINDRDHVILNQKLSLFKINFLQGDFLTQLIIEQSQQFHNKFQLEINKKQLKMENIINSRLKRNQSPTKLENMSPEKFGKSAFAALTYTPSKLVDNVLFRQVTTFKKIEQESSKVRQSQAFNGILKDRLNQLVEERNGIESTLTQQVQMYKKMLNQNEVKHQQRVRAIQKIFSEEMQKIIIVKQQEAKFAQSQKELLQSRICQLENEVGQLKSKLQNAGNNFDELSRKYEKLEIHYKNACQKLEQTQKILKEQEQHSKAQYEELSRKLFNTEVEFKGQIDKLQLQKQRDIQSLEKFHRVELQKVENKRLQQATIKNQELKDLATTFEGEANRLNDIITSKEKNIDHLNSCLNEEKQKILSLTKDYTTEITNLVHEKGRLKQEIDSLNNQLAALKQERKNYQVETQKKIASLEVSINKLQDEIELTHLNYIREKDKTCFVLQDLNRQIAELKVQNSQLKSDNQRLSLYSTENAFLSKENRNLKDILLESSLQLEKCKEEFIKIGREKDNLAVRLRELAYQNETLNRLRVQKEQEARGWRQSYYLSRR